MDLVDYLRILRRRWRIVGATLVMALVAALATTPAETSTPSLPVGTSYRATHTLLQAPDVTTPVNLDLVRLFATTGEIPRRAAVRLGEPPEDGPVLASRVDVVTDGDVQSLTVSVSGNDGARAAAIANAFAAEIVESLRANLQRDRDAELTATRRLVDSLAAHVADLQQQISRSPGEAPLLEAQREAYLSNYTAAFSRLQSLTEQGEVRSPVTTLEEAVPIPVTPAATFSPPASAIGRGGLAGLVGLALGVLLALVLERFDRRLRSREDVEAVTSLPVVAEVPVLPRAARRDWSVQVAVAPGGAVAEAYRSLRSAIMLVPSRPALSSPDAGSGSAVPQVLLVTSPLPADGKTTTVANLAACLAESGRRVLVLDCDFRNPTLHRYLEVPRGRGISDLLAGTSAAELADVVHRSNVPGVHVVTGGNVTHHPAALLARAGRLLDAARQLADVVLIDAAPVLAANDATDLVPYVDAVVLVTRSGRTTRDHALRATELLARLAVPIAGTVLIASNGSAGSYASGLSSVLSRWSSRRRGRSTDPLRAWLAAAGQAGQHARSSQNQEPPARVWPVESADVRPATSPHAVVSDTGWPELAVGSVDHLSRRPALDPTTDAHDREPGVTP